MVKRFKRPGAGEDEQLPSELRPPRVLKETCDYLFEEYLPTLPLAKAHDFVWDRTRAIRNDFSIQQVTSPEDVRLAVECFERITRFHIHSLHELATPEPAHEKYDRKGEVQMLDKTLLSLMHYYDNFGHILRFPCEAEFRSYYIILQIQNPTQGIAEKAQTWDQLMLQHPRVKLALEVWAKSQNAHEGKGPMNPHVATIFAREDYAGFWSTIAEKQTSYLEACMAECYFNHMRYLILKTLLEPTSKRGEIVKGVPDPSEKSLRELLAFDTKADLLEYLNKGGVELVRKDGVSCVDSSNVRRSGALNKLAALPVLKTSWVEDKRAGRTATAVINGVEVVKARENGQAEEMPEARVIEEVMSDKSEEDDGESLFLPMAKSVVNADQNTKTATSGFNPFNNTAKSSASPFAQSSTGKPGSFGALSGSNDPSNKSPFASGKISGGQTSPFSGGAPAIQGSSFGKPSSASPFAQPSSEFGSTPKPVDPFEAFGKQNATTQSPSGTFGKPSRGLQAAEPSESGSNTEGITTNGVNSSTADSADSMVNNNIDVQREKNPSLSGSSSARFGSFSGETTTVLPNANAEQAPKPTFAFGGQSSSNDNGGFGSPLGGEAASKPGTEATSPFTFGHKISSSIFGGFASPSGSTTTASKPAGEEASKPFVFGQKPAFSAGPSDSTANPGSQPFAGFGGFPPSTNTSTTGPKPSTTFSFGQPASPESTQEQEKTKSSFTFGEGSGGASFTDPSGHVNSQAPTQPAQSQRTSSNFKFASPQSQPNSSQAPAQTQPARPPSFSETKHQPKKPSPLSRSYTASDDTTKKKMTQPTPVSQPQLQAAFTQPENTASVQKVAPPVAPPVVDKPDADAILTRVAREYTLEPTYGLLMQWIENEISKTITAAQKQVTAEHIQAIKEEKLAIKYVKKWRAICWRATLKRKGRELRQRTRDKFLRESQAAKDTLKPLENSPFTPAASTPDMTKPMEMPHITASLARSTTSATSTRKRKVSERKEADREYQLSVDVMEEQEQKKRAKEELRKNRRSTSSQGAAQPAKPTPSFHKRFKSTSHVENEGNPSAAAAFVAESQKDMELKQSAFLAYSRPNAGVPLRTTTSSYFRLKALGITPDMKLPSWRESLRLKQSQRASRSSASDSPSRKRRRSETLSLTPEGTPIPSREAHVPLEPSSSPSLQGSSKNKFVKVEEGEETLAARLKAAKEALAKPVDDAASPEEDAEAEKLSVDMRLIRESPTMDLARLEAEKRASEKRVKHVPRYVARESRFLRPHNGFGSSGSYARSRGYSVPQSWAGSRPGSRLDNNAVNTTEEFSPDRPEQQRENGSPVVREVNSPQVQPQQQELSKQTSSAPFSTFEAPSFGGFNSKPFGNSCSQAPTFATSNTQQSQPSGIFDGFGGAAAFKKPDNPACNAPATSDQQSIFSTPYPLRHEAAAPDPVNVSQGQTAQPSTQFKFNPTSQQLSSAPSAAASNAQAEEPPKSFSGFSAAQPSSFSQASTQPSQSFGLGLGSRPAEVPKTQDHTIQRGQISQSLRHSFGSPQAFDKEVMGTQHASESQAEVVELGDSDDGDPGCQDVDRKPEHASHATSQSEEVIGRKPVQDYNPYATLADHDGEEVSESQSEDVNRDLQNNPFNALADEGEDEEDGSSEIREEFSINGYRNGFARSISANAEAVQPDSYLNKNYDSVDEDEQSERHHQGLITSQAKKYPTEDALEYPDETEDSSQDAEEEEDEADAGLDDDMQYEDEGETGLDSQYDSEDYSSSNEADEVPASQYAAAPLHPDRFGRLPPPPPKPELGGSTEEDAIELSD